MRIFWLWKVRYYFRPNSAQNSYCQVVLAKHFSIRNEFQECRRFFFILKNVWVEKEGCSWLTSVIKWPLNVIPTFCPFNTYFFHVCLSVFLYVLRIYFTSVCPFSCRYYVFLSCLFVHLIPSISSSNSFLYVLAFQSFFCFQIIFVLLIISIFLPLSVFYYYLLFLSF